MVAFFVFKKNLYIYSGIVFVFASWFQSHVPLLDCSSVKTVLIDPKRKGKRNKINGRKKGKEKRKVVC